jgi:DNA-binding SARP family transcriptional activator
MYTLRVLGGVALEGPSGKPVGRLSQRRAEAVLAVLAVADALGCTRDRLIALLWPDADHAHGRHDLRDTLCAIRHVLGPEAVVAGPGESLRLNPAVLASDLQRFTSAIAAHRLTDAVEAYGGPFLEGFCLDGAPAFDLWTDVERMRIHRQYAETLEELAGAAERAGSWRLASGWWARSIELDPFNTRAVVRRMWALTYAGDRANAIKDAEAHRRRLEHELEISPDPAFLAEVERVRRGELGPSHFSTPSDVPAPPGAAPPAPPAVAPPGEHAPSGPAARSRRSALVVAGPAAVVAVAAVAAALLWPKAPHRAPVFNRQVIAILPFTAPAGDGMLETLALRLADAWTRELQSGPQPHAAAPATVAAIWRSSRGPDPALDRPRGSEAVARETKAQFVLSASLERAGDQIRVTAFLHRMPGAALQSARSLLVPAESVATATAPLLLQVLADWAGEPKHRVEWLSRRDPQAVRLYLSEAWRVHFLFYREWNDAAVRSWTGEILGRDSLLVYPALAFFHSTGVWRYMLHKPWHDTVAAVAWRRRASLPREDRAYVEALFGPWFGLADTEEARIALWRRAAVEGGDWWRPWFRLAAELSALGTATTMRSWRNEARGAFDRALALSDTSRPEVLELAFWFSLFPGLSKEEGTRPYATVDSLGARALMAAAERRGIRMGGLYITVPDDWRPGLAMALGDRSADDYWTLKARGEGAMRAIRVATAIASALPAGVPTADATVRAWEATPDARTPSLAQSWAGSWWRTRGQHADWVRNFRASLGVLPAQADPRLNDIVNDVSLVQAVAYLGYPRDALAATAVARLERIANGDSTPAPEPGVVGVAHCWLAQGRLAQGDTTGAARAITVLRALDRRDRAGRQDGLPGGQRWVVCPAVLEAQLARVTGRQPLKAARALDALLKPMPIPRRGIYEAWEGAAHHDLTRFIDNLLAARLLAAAGDTAAALAASRRYPRDIQTIVDYVYSLPEYLREEGRFAAAMGDTVGAVRAYEHYLGLRTEPPDYGPWRTEWDAVGAHLAALTRRR